MGFIFPYKVKVVKKRFISDRIVKLSIEKPYNYNCKLGQVIDLSIDAPQFGLEVDTFTIIDVSGNTFFDIIVKNCPNDSKISDYLSIINTNESIFISDAWDAQEYKGPGLFIVENVFIARILNILKKITPDSTTISNHKLLLLSETKAEVLFDLEMKKILGTNYKNIYIDNSIDYYALLKKRLKNLDQKIYICGSYKFEKNIISALLTIGFSREQINTGK
jgi:ferredoxin-NADP reductase